MQATFFTVKNLLPIVNVPPRQFEANAILNKFLGNLSHPSYVPIVERDSQINLVTLFLLERLGMEYFVQWCNLLASMGFILSGTDVIPAEKSTVFPRSSRELPLNFPQGSHPFLII